MTSKFEIEKVKQEIKVLEKKLALLEELEKTKSPVEEAYKDWWGQYPELETDSEYDEMRWQGFQAGFQAAYEEKVREDNYYDEVVTQKNTEPYYIDDPECCSGIEWDRKDNPKPVDEVINRMVEERNSKKLWNILKDKWGFPEDACGDIVEAVAEWLPKEQSASGSQNTFVEEIVEGYNDCLREMKEMLR